MNLAKYQALLSVVESGKPDRRGGAAWADAVGGESQHQQS